MKKKLTTYKLTHKQWNDFDLIISLFSFQILFYLMLRYLEEKPFVNVAKLRFRSSNGETGLAHN